MIDFTIKPEKLSKTTLEDAEKHSQLINGLNYLIEEGFIYVKEGADGQLRLYPR